MMLAINVGPSKLLVVFDEYYLNQFEFLRLELYLKKYNEKMCYSWVFLGHFSNKLSFEGI